MLELIRKDVAVMTKSHFPVAFMVLPCLESDEWSEFLHLRGMRVRGNGKESDHHNLGIGEAAVWEGTRKAESLLAEDKAEKGIWWGLSLEEVLGCDCRAVTDHTSQHQNCWALTETSRGYFRSAEKKEFLLCPKLLTLLLEETVKQAMSSTQRELEHVCSECWCWGSVWEINHK